MPSPASTPISLRNEPRVYSLPDTKYFKELVPTLRDLSSYAEAERRAAEVFHLLRRSLVVPLLGRFYYSPGGAAVVERARETGNADFANSRWSRAAVFSPGTAVLGLGTVANVNGVLQAGAAGPIMIGKAGYFAYAAGVNTEPLTVETQFAIKDVLAIFRDTVEILEKELRKIYPPKNGHPLFDIDKVVKGLQLKFLPPRDKSETYTEWVNKTVQLLPEFVEGFVETVSKSVAQKMVKKLAGSQSEQVIDFDAIQKKVQAGQNKIMQVARAALFARSVANYANNYGFINIEDAQGADLPLILGMLESMNLGSAVWSDDLQGTGVISAAGVLNWAEQTGRLNTENPDKALEGIKVVIFGAGAGAMGVYNELVNNGVRPEDILVTDSGPDKDYSGKPYVLDESRQDVKSDPYKWRMAQKIKAGTTVEDFVKGTADDRKASVIINLGDKKTLLRDLSWTRDLTLSLDANPLFAPMTNPDPGIKPEWLKAVRSDAYFASGNQLYENVFNNFTAFSFIGLGALMAGAKTINKEMTVAAARGIAKVAKMREVFETNPRQSLVPDPLDVRLIIEEAGAVAMAAARSGVSTFLGINPSDEALAQFQDYLNRELELRQQAVLRAREATYESAHQHYKEHYPDRYAPFYLKDGDKDPVYYVTPKVEVSDLDYFARRFGMSERYKDLLDGDKLKAKSLTELLETIKQSANKKGNPLGHLALTELDIICQISYVSPSMGLALALRKVRSLAHPENLTERPTVFHKDGVLAALREYLPVALAPVESLMRDADQLKQTPLDLSGDTQPLPTIEIVEPALTVEDGLTDETIGAEAVPVLAEGVAAATVVGMPSPGVPGGIKF